MEKIHSNNAPIHLWIVHCILILACFRQWLAAWKPISTEYIKSSQVKSLLYRLLHPSDWTTDIDRRSQNSYIASWNGVVSHVAKIGVFGFLFADHKQKQMQTKCIHDLCTPCSISCVYLHAQTAVLMHLMNHGYLDRRKNLNTPNWRLMPE